MDIPSPTGSVVIPAHNEASVIRRCLDALLAGFSPGDLDVVVSCNGCTDDTAGIIRRAGYRVRVVEVQKASKPAALRAADDQLGPFPRLYLDADVVLPGESARVVLERLRSGPALAARPPIRYDTTGAAPLVRSYYRARTRVPGVMNSLWGAGVFGLSAVGRARFDTFPDVIADDLFVDQHFDKSEIEIVQCPSVVVNAPRRAADLFRILRRTYHGNAENRAISEESASTAKCTAQELVATMSARPVSVLDTAIYLGVAATAKATLMVARPTRWGRDESSRA